MRKIILISLTALTGFGIMGCSRPSIQSSMDNNTINGKAFDLQGHRGARGLVPENTIPAFIRALEIGVTTLEMDVAISSDEEVIVSHEAWMSAAICSHPNGDPVTVDEEKSVRLYEMTASHIATFDCGLRGHPLFPEQVPQAAYKPRLRDVISAVNEYVQTNGIPTPRYNIEIKSSPEGDSLFHPPVERFAELLYTVLAEASLLDLADIQSFDARALEAVRKIDPSVGLVWLISNQDGFDVNMNKLTFTPAIYSPNHQLVDSLLVSQAHERGMKLIPWTVNEVERMRQLIDLGVDGLITDYPDRTKKLIADLNR